MPGAGAGKLGSVGRCSGRPGACRLCIFRSEPGRTGGALCPEGNALSSRPPFWPGHPGIGSRRRRSGRGAETGRHAGHPALGQPGQHVDPRGGDLLGRRADHGRHEQSRPVPTRTRRRTAWTTIVPDLAESWSWSEDGKELTFKLRQGVKWHDGKPFTAADVKCTLDLLQGKAKDRLRGNPRKEWYNNVQEVTTNGDYEAVFKLKRPQPALLTLLASGYSPIYPCHVTPAQMRQHPIGTGPFKFVEYQAERTHQGRQEPGLLEEGPPLSRRRSNTRSCRTARPRSSALSPGSTT